MPANSQNQKTITFAQNSGAQNDNFADLPNSKDHFVLDVLANDRGGQAGQAKVLWSLDEGSGRWNEPSDLLTQDDLNSINYSQLNAQISIMEDGKVLYVITPELQSKLDDLSIGETLTDTFIYAMKTGQGNSPLNWAKATVTLNGLNHAPELTGTTAILPDGTQNTDYTILASNLLQGFTDEDHDDLSVANLTVTHGTLTQTADGWIFTPENNFTGEVELSYDIVDGHGGSLGAAQRFTLAPDLLDKVAPTLTWSEPSDDSIAFPANNNIVLHFDEPVVPGTGNIVITNGTDTQLISASDSSQVTFSGSKVTINPSANLVPNTTYHIEMASGVIADYSGNPYAGIHDPSTLNFTTIPDTTAPFLLWSWPSDDQSFFVDDNFIFNFSEEIKAGAGNIIISNGSDTRTIAINDPSQVSFESSNRVIINPSENLIPGTNYSVKIDNGAITDLSGNPYAGISDDTSLNVITVSSDPLLIGSTPLDDTADFLVDNNIVLNFNEFVSAGIGSFVISNGTDTRVIAVDDGSQVTFSGGKVTINPSTNLVPNTTYHIEMNSGVITDLGGNPYAGISDDTTLNFTTVSSDPLLLSSLPIDDAVNVPADGNIVLYFNESVSPGIGNFVISNGTDTRVIAADDNSQVSFSGSKVVINPSANLVPNTTYHVEMNSGVITDLEGNPYAGINDDTTLNFTAIAGNPHLTSSTPSDDAVNVAVSSDIALVFDEAVMAASGNIVISNGSDTRTISINDSSQITFSGSKIGGSQIVINPADNLLPNTTYHIQIDESAITDLIGNSYAGISDETTLNFTTASDTGPYLIEPMFFDPMNSLVTGVTDSNLAIIT